ncbi:hypothetical protein [Paenibacillus tengchongensis]|uniref:hypothetical protein n=1 Tax=Paenibacillus tengchongensis TaxID=2608684 RepID=UPI00124EC945|nr:hypothetical protein [Paenibacillus tengchongensis]
MKHKYLFLLPLALMLGLLCSGCIQERQPEQISHNSAGQADYSQMDLAEIYEELAELTAASPLIAEVELTGNSGKLAYAGANFVMNEVKITDVIHGDASTAGQTLGILEVSAFSMNLNQSSSRLILFLQRYEGPATAEETYVITGVYQGKYEIGEDGNVRYPAGELGGVVTFQPEVTPARVKEFKRSIVMSLEPSDNDTAAKK